jgi:signal transduction histidine kinase
MKQHLRAVEPDGTTMKSSGPYHEIAVQVRDLLRCEYALVATPENDSLHVRAIVGGDGQKPTKLLSLISQLRDRMPVVVPDSDIVAAPVVRDDTRIGLLVGYSSKHGSFTGHDLQRLTVFSQIAARLIENAAAVGTSRTFTTDELLHLSRLITMGEISACFAHEVTNPLMLIRGHLQFMERDIAEGHPMRINFEVIDRASKRIEEMAKRMLDFSRKRTPLTEKCDIGEIISDAVRFIQPYFRTQYIDVRVQIEPNVPALALNRWQVIQAIVNLLQNAADAMTGLNKRILSIEAKLEADQVRIEVSDTGTGIAPAILPHIFEPFFTTKGERGTGLGLYITRQVIVDQGGTIDVQPSERGTTFVISLPL